MKMVKYYTSIYTEYDTNIMLVNISMYYIYIIHGTWSCLCMYVYRIYITTAVQQKFLSDVVAKVLPT